MEAAASFPIPHRAPFLFLSRAEGIVANEGLFSFEVPRKGECFSRRIFPQLQMVESMAQAAAAWHGLLAQQQGSREGEQGVLASIDRVKFHGAPQPGNTLVVKIRHKKTFGALVMLDGEVWRNHQLLAQAELVVRRGDPSVEEGS